jgi:ATP phosphoribosyltransferase regulatory subunit
MVRYDRITPEGTRDLLFEECEAINAVKRSLRGIFEGRGYREVMTPGFEFYDVFSSNAAHYPQESMYSLVDGRGRLMAARPDSTIPIARMTAARLRGHELPIRLYYAQHVFRRQPELKGRRSEIMQMGIELIGSPGFDADVEILAAAAEALDACASPPFRIEIGHVGIFSRLMAGLDAGAAEKERVHRHIASKNYSALNDALDGLKPDGAIGILRELPRLFGGPEALEQAAALFRGHDEALSEMLEYLKRVYGALEGLGLGGRIMIDLGLVNQAEYYSSLVFKAYTAGSGDAVLSGGRYDGLFRDFGDDLPATGFAFNVDALADGMLKARAGGPAPARPRGDGIRVALTKGRLERDVIALLDAAGYDVSPLRDRGRRLLAAIPGTGIEAVLAKAADVITYVEHGVCDVGIVGKDTIAEHGGVFYEIMDLGLGRCRFALAAPKGTDFYGGFGTRRIATKYPGVAGSWFESKGMDVRIIKIEGSVELAPLLSLADGIVDIVETGATLRENGLEVIEEIRPVSARMIVNVACMKMKKKAIDAFAASLGRVIGGGT